MNESPEPLRELVGDMDIQLVDLILRGRVPAGARVLDAGCGQGRNLPYFLKTGRRVAGLDPDPRRLERARALAAAAGQDDPSAFRAESLDETSFPAASFDLVICNAVLHFARDERQFRAMTDAIARLLVPGGLAFCRLASDLGIAGLLRPAPDRDGRWRRLPDGSDRFVVDLDFLLAETERLGATLDGALKTVNVQNRRCMSTWIWRLPDA